VPTGVYIRTEKHRKVLSESMKGRSSWNKGKTWEEMYGIDGAKKMQEERNSRRGLTKENCAWRKQQADKLRGKPLAHKEGCICCICKAKRGESIGAANPFYGRKHFLPTKCGIHLLGKTYEQLYGKEKTYQKKSSMRKGMEKHWVKDKQTGSLHRKKIFAALRREMSSYEIRLDDFIQKFNLPYKFVGNGEVIIGHLNPDFIYTGEKKIVLEVYSQGHLGNLKPKNYEETRRKILRGYGYEVIYLTESDLFCENWEEHCLSKIK
jgi:very-short-patch-repair endonuclease